MSANDSPMTRFLFAILQQKCLKDIDWEKVAHDPILLQDISNGHAARMRYSRFKSTMLGLQPQRRNRTASNPSPTGTSSSRVSKKKRDDKARRNNERDAAAAATAAAVKLETGGIIIKPEPDVLGGRRLFPATTTSTTTATTPEPPHHHHQQMAGLDLGGGDMHARSMHMQRLLTPCSDSDVMAASTAMAATAHPFSTMASPGSEMDILRQQQQQQQHADAPFDFSGGVHHNQQHDNSSGSWHHHHHQATYQSPSSYHSPASYSGFALGYGNGGDDGSEGDYDVLGAMLEQHDDGV
ncbi:hypothetical protein B0T26DRAFT_680240 [Lasiosphaeria miniovina]|uniref:Myb-like DNA-binding domain-containing protein n=1 Tax=Lasiosphaeria miniovina TaxID=1954250 RepID=A0AA39ZZL4_9PEZI|nr:uncharacterized protein B0T26DRAFT_680240 [Lasiosphaeria miniovina]KAK0706573.1 hypothetical protein B0T26DRAFT_680240 [Lasiosphaeria miniovina]